MFYKRGVLKNFAKSQKSTGPRVSFLRPDACNFIKKENLAQVFSWEFSEIFLKIFFYRTPIVAASDMETYFHIHGKIDASIKEN